MSSNQQISDYIFFYPDVMDKKTCEWIINRYDTTAKWQQSTFSNNFLSGVYYLQSYDQGASIMFQDPRPAAGVILPRMTEQTIANANLLSYASKQNRAMFFPSWLPHYVKPNKSESKRISIAWNVQVKGPVGEHHEFQSADF